VVVLKGISPDAVPLLDRHSAVKLERMAESDASLNTDLWAIYELS
jgi:hypothetical protein